MDLRTSEFHVVGDTIKQYASEDATVVVGYVIDPEMTDQIRVTVVATGIGRPAAVRGIPVSAQPKIEVVAGVRSPRRGGIESYADYETPANLRRRQRAVGDDLRADASGESFLDIPAFLRRQAD
jgi:cell division protein FtsZ